MRIQGLGFSVKDLGFRVKDLGFKVWSLGSRPSAKGFLRDLYLMFIHSKSEDEFGVGIRPWDLVASKS